MSVTSSILQDAVRSRTACLSVPSVISDSTALPLLSTNTHCNTRSVFSLSHVSINITGKESNHLCHLILLTEQIIKMTKRSPEGAEQRQRRDTGDTTRETCVLQSADHTVGLINVPCVTTVSVQSYKLTPLFVHVIGSRQMNRHACKSEDLRPNVMRLVPCRLKQENKCESNAPAIRRSNCNQKTGETESNQDRRVMEINSNRGSIIQ